MKINAFTFGSRITAAAAAIVLAVTAAVTAFALPAEATNIGDHNQLVSYYYEDQCLSANFSNAVYMTPCSTSIYHQWAINQGNVEIFNYGTKNCLSSNPNTGIYTVAESTCLDSVKWHNWGIYDAVYNDQGVLIRVMLQNFDSNLCLSTNNTTVFGTGCNTAHSQQWWYVD